MGAARPGRGQRKVPAALSTRTRVSETMAMVRVVAPGSGGTSGPRGRPAIPRPNPLHMGICVPLVGDRQQCCWAGARRRPRPAEPCLGLTKQGQGLEPLCCCRPSGLKLLSTGKKGLRRTFVLPVVGDHAPPTSPHHQQRLSLLSCPVLNRSHAYPGGDMEKRLEVGAHFLSAAPRSSVFSC